MLRQCYGDGTELVGRWIFLLGSFTSSSDLNAALSATTQGNRWAGKGFLRGPSAPWFKGLLGGGGI